MANARHYSWLLALVAFALGHPLTAQVVDGPPFTVQDSRASNQVIIRRSFAFISPNGAQTIYYSLNGSPYTAVNVGTIASSRFTKDSYVTGWSGFSYANSPLTFTTGEGTPQVITWRRTASGADLGTATMNMGPVECIVTYNGANSSWDILNYTAENDFLITLAPDGSGVVDDPTVEPPAPEFEEGVLLFDNRSGLKHYMLFGAEGLVLEPGYNAFPFYGAVDSNGMPQALPEGVSMSRVVGADGQTYWVARLENRLESPGTVWVSPPSVTEVLQNTSGTSGPTVKIPDGGTGHDYVTLPPGMTRGSKLPLPPGVTTGDLRLPPGVTPGTSGSLPKGVISGGTSNLPPGVSAGTVAGNNPTTNPPPTGTRPGGSTGTVGSSKDGPAAGYVPAPNIVGGFEEDAENDAEQTVADYLAKKQRNLDEAKQSLEAGPVAGLEALAPSPSGIGKDFSWSSLTLNLAAGGVHTITIQRQYIDLVRALLLWAMRIGLVILTIKLIVL